MIRPTNAKDFIIPHMALRLEKLPTHGLCSYNISTQSLHIQNSKECRPRVRDGEKVTAIGRRVVTISLPKYGSNYTSGGQ